MLGMAGEPQAAVEARAAHQQGSSLQRTTNKPTNYWRPNQRSVEAAAANLHHQAAAQARPQRRTCGLACSREARPVRNDLPLRATNWA